MTSGFNLLIADAHVFVVELSLSESYFVVVYFARERLLRVTLLSEFGYLSASHLCSLISLGERINAEGNLNYECGHQT